MIENHRLSSPKDWRGKLAVVRKDGRQVALVCGAFDLLRGRHLELFEAARATGGFVVVGLLSDATVREREGEGRPLVPAEERAELLIHYEAVDLAVIADSGAELELLRTVTPDIYLVKASSPPSATDVPEGEVPEGVEIRRVPVTGGTTAELLDAMARL